MTLGSLSYSNHLDPIHIHIHLHIHTLHTLHTLHTNTHTHKLTIVGVKVAVAGVHGEQSPSVGQGMISQVGQRVVQLLLHQLGALLSGGGRLLTQLAGRAARGGGLGAEGIAPLSVV